MNKLFSQRILKHYHNPLNYGRPHCLKGWTKFTIYNTYCGDKINLYLKINEEQKIIDLKFNAQACSICVASASLFYSKIKDRNINIIDEFSEKEVLKLTHTLKDSQRTQCALLCYNIFKKNN